ncbi:DMT family transporter [Pseudomonas sp. CDFA 610]|uniref:DMT family transporter n=1 Tax=Pseudomonas sp. CDFA 610 TaxID=2829825 RepID=UPI001E40DD8E|nr:DMT family transporter [Pseudomonas sp. CDFA 610]
MNTVPDEKQGRMAMILAMIISGTIGFFVVSSEQSPFNVVFFRCVIGGAGLLLYCLFKGYYSGIKLTSRQVLFLVVGALTLIFNWVFLFTAYRLTSIGITTIIYHLQPFFLLFSSLLFMKESLKRSNLAWLILAFLGLVIVVKPDQAAMDDRFLLGCLSALAAAILYAITTLMTRQISNVLRPEVIASSHMVIGSLVFLFLADFSALPSTAVHWGAIVTLGLFHTTFMYLLLYTAFKKAATASLAIFGFLYPLVALIVDYFAFDHVISVWQALGAVLILASGLAYNYGISIPFVERKSAVGKVPN